MPVLNAARGLLTQQNELSRPDGSLVIADNVNIDFDGVIQKRRGFRDYNAIELADHASQLFTYKRNILAYAGEILYSDVASSGAFTSFNGTYKPLIDGLRIKGLEANGNFYFTTSTGIKKISADSSATVPTSIISNSGGIKASDLSGKLMPTSAGFLPAQSKVAYRVVFGTKDANNNLILGAPSARAVLINQSQDINISEIFTVNFLAVGTIVNSDYWLFNDKDQGYYVWYNLDGTASAPVSADTVDRVGIEVDLDGVSSPTATQFANYTASALAKVSSISIELSTTEIEVTLINPGDQIDASQGTVATSEILITKIVDGQIAAGTPASVDLNFSLPQTITTAYFYQIYRTGVVTVSAGVTLNDLDPGDEQQYVFEYPITAADITAGEITVNDNTPEAFRQSGANLYTNAITGEGIVQANNPPPIAQDMALFRDSTFYANTKDFHRTTFTILSVDDFVSGNTKLSIGQANKLTEYTFVGVKEVVDITVVAKSATTGGTIILINSANDERSYYIWLDTGSSTDPVVPDAQGIRIPLELYPDTVAGSKQALLDALLLVPDFVAVDHSTSVVRITNIDSGNATNPTTNASWTVNVVTEGLGEDVATRKVLWSQSPSIGIAIDLTARSLVKVINRDANSPVTAQYLSSTEDLPGKILLEAKSLEDSSFFLAISDSVLSEEFNPEIPATKVLTNMEVAGNLFTTSTAHGFAIGDRVYINNKDIPLFAGNYVVQTVPSSTTFTLKDVTIAPDQLGLSGVVFAGTAASDNNTSPNRLAFSKIGQPEAVPISNFVDVGSKDKAVLRILALRDNLFVLKEDGIFIVTGASAPNFSVKLLDNSAILIAPDSAVVLNNLIYALTTQGVVSIGDSGVSIISRNIEDLIKKYTTNNFNYRYTSFGVSYESDRAYFLWLPEIKSDSVATQCFRYNTITNTWTRWTVGARCGIVDQLGDDRLYISNSSRKYIYQERKELERQDGSDRNFTRSLGSDSVSDDMLKLSSTLEVAAGDVVVQEQYASIPTFNRLLTKLDRDNAITDEDYAATLTLERGANMVNAMIALITKLNDDANLSGTFPVPSGLNDKISLRDDYNAIIDELNSEFSGTALKNYRRADDLLIYEVLITEVPKNTNDVIVNFQTWFIQGDVEIYKAIVSKVRYSPQHFGNPAQLKQIPEGTLIFDQNNFYGGVVAYASDRSADFVPIPFKMAGPGFWACYKWLDNVFGGGGRDLPLRTLIPQSKSRCRYLTVEFTHSNAREQFKLIGISLEPRAVSTRAYRGV